MNCPICGTDIPEGSHVCPGCDSSVNDILRSPKEKKEIRAAEEKQRVEERKQIEETKIAQAEEAKRIEAAKKQLEEEAKLLEYERKVLEGLRKESEKSAAEAAAAAVAATAAAAAAASQNNGTQQTSTGQAIKVDQIDTGSVGIGKQPQPPKSNGKAVIAGICALALAGGGLGGYAVLKGRNSSGNTASSINLSNYMELEFSGTDGDGIVVGNYNLSGLVNGNPEAFTMTDENRTKIREMFHVLSSTEMSDNELLNLLFEDLFDGGIVSVEFQPDTDLKNGDKVTVSWIAGEKTLEDLFGVNFICDTTAYTVSGLDSVTETAEVLKDEKKEAASGEEKEEEKQEEKQEEQKTEENKTEKKKSENYGKYKLVNTDYLTLRSSATMNDKNNKILKIPADSEVTVLEFGCNGYWKVKYEDTEGYVLPSYLAPSTGAKSMKKICDYVVTTDYVTMRDIPSTAGEDWGRITNGTIVECYDTADNDFLLIQYNGKVGYILKYYNGETLVKKK